MPVEWCTSLLGDLISIKHGYAFKSQHFADSGECVVLTPGNFFEEGGFRSRGEHDRYYTAEFPPEYLLKAGDLIVAMTEQAEGLLGSPAIIPAGGKYLHNQRLGLVSIRDQRRLHRDFLFRLLNADPVRRHISVTAGGTKVRHTSPAKILSTRVYLPPLPEQRKIAEILSTWDRAIEQIGDLIAAKQRLKKGLMQQILAGKLRFPQFGRPTGGPDVLPAGWSRARLSDVFERVTRTVGDARDAEPLSITATVGFVRQRDKFSRVIAGKQLQDYILLRRGEFAYNKGNSDAYPQGCIHRLMEYEQAAVPHVYFCFRGKGDNVDPGFYAFYFQLGLLNGQLSRLINSGVRNDGLLNLPADGFFKMTLLVPPVPEQKRIAVALRVCDAELSALRRHLAALQQQKKGLMQKLLTGKVRVTTRETTEDVS
ncbi:MAG: hypothetical protein A3K19_20170 [Lentisphaerae bacterium RIFOXYB12_FULL_65_16]|nr:MAG: hypothetical protein A3K18_11250 [Lentisphaerae bacterium RIFOXYA12_64_32]OGV91788.1 MAG: hypothetical protein A3K19_20170 [Lentisphaerae bacterium RIFOXYB12_FULL_65_16]